MTSKRGLPAVMEAGEEEGDDAFLATMPSLAATGTTPHDSLSEAGSLGASTKKKIGGKLKLSYATPEAKPVAKPYTDVDEEEMVRDNPPPQTHATLTSMRSPQNPKKREPKIALEY